MNDRGGHLEWEHEPREGEAGRYYKDVHIKLGKGMFTHVHRKWGVNLFIITQLLSISQTISHSILLSFSHTHTHTHTHTHAHLLDTCKHAHILCNTTHKHTCNHTLIMSLRFKALVDIVRNEQQHAELF